MWIYSQSTGELYGPSGHAVATGYSGKGEHKNVPTDQHLAGEGPIPRGKWFIRDMYDSSTCGPFCLRLEPLSGTETFGRTDFLIHGDSVKFPGEASRGCIILPRRIREYIWDSEDADLEVVA